MINGERGLPINLAGRPPLANTLYPCYGHFTGVGIICVLQLYSKLFGIIDDTVLLVANHFNCIRQDFPIVYLGLPLTMGRLHRADIWPMIEKISGKLKVWKPKLLMAGGRLTLTRSVLMALEHLQPSPRRGPPQSFFFIRTAKNGLVAPPVPRFRLDLGFRPSSEPMSSPAPRGALGGSRGNKSARNIKESSRAPGGPDLSARKAGRRLIRCKRIYNF
jgi:hypothetical protein